MLYLAIIFHMHQPYYKNLLTKETPVPWVRLHGVKDYLDMVQILAKYPSVHQVFNIVPSLFEQVEDYTRGDIKDRFLELSYKPAAELTNEEKDFILDRFFYINRERVVAIFPRYYELYLKRLSGRPFNQTDYLDLQVCFNLAWIDPSFRAGIPELKAMVDKGRFFTEEDKRLVLDTQAQILKDIIPAYRKFIQGPQLELSLSPYYHPILPLLFNTNIAKEADQKAHLPKINFSYPQDAKSQIEMACAFFKEKFAQEPCGMWPSEESVCDHIIPFIIQAGIKWIVADEAILFRSKKMKKRDTQLLYQPHVIRKQEGELNIIFRDRNLSDLIGFVYHRYETKAAVDDFMGHLKNISEALKGKDILVTIAMDGENAWEYYLNDGHDFLNLLYERLSEAEFLKTVTIKEYLNIHKPVSQIKRVSAGSWIFGNFSKWINNPTKNLAWEYLALARKELDGFIAQNPQSDKIPLAFKQMYVAEGSDWFWWYGDKQADFDYLFRMHLSNFYAIINKPIPDYLNKPLE